MKQEEEELLLQDLCGRLPYGIKCYITEINDTRTLGTIVYNKENSLFDFWNVSNTRYEYQLYLSEFKPYLFPLTEEILDKATEESISLYKELITSDSDLYKENNKPNTLQLQAQIRSSVIKYFIIHHIDYNGLIEKGLAIDATNLNIY